MSGSKDTDFTFINLSHPDDLKDQDTIDHIRSSAMTNFGRQRRRRKKKVAQDEIVFELQAPNAAGPSRAGPATTDTTAAQSLQAEVDNSGAWAELFSDHEPHVTAPPSAISSPLSFDGLSFSNTSADDFHSHMGLDSEHGMSYDTLGPANDDARATGSLNDGTEDRSEDKMLEKMDEILTRDYVLGDYDQWNRRMQALLQIIAMKRSIDCEQAERLVENFSWNNIVGSFAQDMVPYLIPPIQWQQLSPTPPLVNNMSTASFATGASAQISVTWREQFPDAQGWLSMYEKIRTVLVAPNILPCDWMNPILHGLLSFRPMQGNQNHQPTNIQIIEEVCRVGTLLFLAPIWRSFSAQPVRTAKLRGNLSSTILNYFADWRELRVLLVWTLAHAVRESEDQVERREFALRLAMVMSKMGIGGWRDAIGLIEGVLPTVSAFVSWQSVDDALTEVLQPTNNFRRNSDRVT
ncbi:hypothetical protein BU24DRAFT_220586 [Aaosphaeria arxii CBS 175.79]|uniref:Uncharacterized protein n=1 Tax=Aaosphaeria arxii CBS 175.79 TaxID=1450172 RepID=A0A6A5XPH0_9PLEO|nr:uncharacterized protein BU24DRAFT_220586 [Aaosphaeria arxii CBS 175.79]KAF2014737.1 hypothetical protein BU24DRAFT_220586 [Aaosphaeria arxii CBS 175.79]